MKDEVSALLFHQPAESQRLLISTMTQDPSAPSGATEGRGLTFN